MRLLSRDDMLNYQFGMVAIQKDLVLRQPKKETLFWEKATCSQALGKNDMLKRYSRAERRQANGRCQARAARRIFAIQPS